jgi:nucleoside-diphosphate-sugar epimerase
MKIFVTGATGYIGSVVTEKLLAAGHTVAGLVRSDASAQKLSALGGEPVRGSLRDLAVIETAARASDAVIHLGMEFSADAPVLDRGVVEAILAGVGSTGKPFVYTSGVWVAGASKGRVMDETTPLNPTPLVAWRPAHENRVLQAGGIVIRPAMVYGRTGGIIGGFVAAAKSGAVQFVGTGDNRWPLVHVDDLADLYVLALGAAPGSLYFASAGASIPVRQIAQLAARQARLDAVPIEEARKTMGPLADALVLDQLISARKAVEELGWAPKRKPLPQELAVS